MSNQEWLEQYEDEADYLYEETVHLGKLNLPGITSYYDEDRYYKEGKQIPPEEVIQGILRKRRKMMIAGPSKAAKTCLLLELAVALTEGRPWLGIPCKKSRVLYVNLELDETTVNDRLRRIYENLGIVTEDNENLDQLKIWNLRGHSHSVAALAKPLAFVCIMKNIDVLIIDPIYKLMDGDENSATEVARACNYLDWITREAGCALIFSHHHSKGAKGNRQVLDRSSGSGVFARDPDAILDLLQLDPPEPVLDKMGGGLITAWRMEAVLREFPTIEPINLWFRFPLHFEDTEGLLNETSALGSSKANLLKSSKRTTREEREEAFRKAFEELSDGGRPVKIADMAKKMNVSQQTVRNRFEEVQSEYWMENRMIGKLAQPA